MTTHTTHQSPPAQPEPGHPRSAEQPPVVRLSGASGITLAAATSLGFEPENSIVALALCAPRGRIGLVARVDLFDPADTEPAEHLVAAMGRHADAVAVVCYHDGERPACLDTFLDLLTAARVPVHSVLSVAHGMIRVADTAAAFDADPGEPRPTADDPQRLRLTAATTLAGVRTLPDRGALADSIAGPTGATAVAAETAIRAAAALWPPRTGRPGRRLDRRTAARADALLLAGLTELAETGAVGHSTAAELIAAAQHPSYRDHLVARAVGLGASAALPLLIEVCTHCPSEFAAQWCAITAYTAYRYGEGALANCALERVFAVDPAHPMGQLLATAIENLLPPHAFAELADDLRWPLAGYDRVTPHSIAS